MKTVDWLTNCEVEILAIDGKTLRGSKDGTVLRHHWLIENRLHYVRDVTLGKDGYRVRSGSAPQVLAGLHNAVVNLISTIKAEIRPAAIEQLNAEPNQAMELLDADHFQ